MIALPAIPKNKWKTLSFVLLILLLLFCVDWVKRNVTLKPPGFFDFYSSSIKAHTISAVLSTSMGLDREDYDQSRKHFEDARTAAYKSTGGVLFFSAIHAAKNGDFVEAESLINDATTLWIKNSELTMFMLLCYMKTGDNEELVSRILEAIEIQSPRSAYLDAMVSAVHGQPVDLDTLETKRQIEYVKLLKEIAATEPRVFERNGQSIDDESMEAEE